MSASLRQLRPARLAARTRRALARGVRRLRGVDRRVVSLAPEGEPVGRALFSYIIDPFLLPTSADVSYSHTHYWESRTMAETLRSLGFEVDVVHWTNSAFEPRRSYDVFVDVRLNIERLGPKLGDECVKILHCETAHWSHHNPAQLARLEALAERRGVRLRPRKMLEPNRAIETADCATHLGNEFTAATYRAVADRPMYRLPLSQPFLYDFPEERDWADCRRRFLWFGSGGMVHKGLDLVLEAFASMPDLELSVVGPVAREPDFERAFARELYESANIHTYDWLDIGGEDFRRLTRSTLALVFPSCSEAQAGSTVTTMHAGLLPVVSRECGASVDDFGVVLAGNDVATIRTAVRELAARPADELEARARRAWHYAREHHTRERFREAYREALLAILDRFRPAFADAVRPG